MNPCYPQRCRASSRRALVISCLLLLVTPSWSAEPPHGEVTPQQIGRWIRELGARSFVQREVAAQQLLLCGQDAIEPLEASAKSPDREVRERSRQILAQLQKRQRDAILAGFRRPAANRSNESVPGWKAFSQRYGEGPAAREIYAEMLESEWELLSDVFASEPPPQQDNKIAQRYAQIQRVGSNYYLAASRGTVLTMFLLAAQFPDEFADHGQLFSFTRNPGIHRMLIDVTPGQRSDEKFVRKILGDWLLAASGSHLDEGLCMQVTLLYRMHEVGSAIGKRILSRPDSSPMSKDRAMQAIVLRNDVSQAPLIERYMTDTTVLGSKDQRVRQVRDVALACLMKLHGHDLGQIGVRPGQVTAHQAFEFGSLGFTTEAEREKAFQTYQRLQAEKKQAAKRKTSG